MNKIEYELKKDEKNNHYVEMENTNMSLEDRFFCFEIVSDILFEFFRGNKSNIDDEFIKQLQNAGIVVNDISQKFGKMIQERDKAINDIDDIINPTE